MKKIVKNRFDDWEISLLVFKDSGTKKYKVTRRLPSMTIAETKIFQSMEEAMTQFEDWIN
jgi:hypothetical protein